MDGGNDTALDASGCKAVPHGLSSVLLAGPIETAREEEKNDRGGPTPFVARQRNPKTAVKELGQPPQLMIEGGKKGRKRNAARAMVASPVKPKHDPCWAQDTDDAEDWFDAQQITVEKPPSGNPIAAK